MLEKTKNFIQSLIGTISEFLSKRKELWFVPAVILLALGLARLVVLVLFYWLLPASSNGQVFAGAPIEKKKSLPQLDVSSFLMGPLFKGNSNAPAVGELPQQNTQPNVPFTLLGTLEGHPDFARAIVYVEGEGFNQEYGVRQKIGNARILSIRRNYIWVIENGNRYKVKVGEQSSQAVQAMPVPVSSNPETIVKVISREEINQKILGNPSAIYNGARFGPLLENDRIVGYKLYAVEPSHVFYSLGARSGDVIKSVNGYPLDDTERMFELWKAAPNMDSMKVVIDRNGAIQNYQFHVRN